MVAPYDFTAGRLPLLVSLPHDSSYVPPEITGRMTEAALVTPDTDWHVAKLYDFAAELGASVLTATHSRYVIDLNRDPSGAALYRNASNTELCPVTTFEFEPLYKDGEEPDDREIARRTIDYWQPYHDKIAAELAALKAKHGVAILFDGHTIKSEVSRFYEGRIPDLNLGTASGASADADLAEQAFSTLVGNDYSAVWDERFTGGYITRHYGDPAHNIHALQLELTWRTYMDETSFAYLPDRAALLKPLLQSLLHTLVNWGNINATG
ncbi:MAG: N-formylglutamate deformylase [Rhodospirillaceae bacterium]|jgi:N-formylglutamate deformylase|nr:N-formylglutamate deformylase [Rhodospirillaceae bacterium]MBT5457612.1 N-formylglutamate deformylase [Rhodospirillaceae bacterium]